MCGFALVVVCVCVCVCVCVRVCGVVCVGAQNCLAVYPPAYDGVLEACLRHAAP